MNFFIDRHEINTRAQLSNLASISGLVLPLVSVFISLFFPNWSRLAYFCSVSEQAVEKETRPFLFYRNAYGDLFQGLFRDNLFVLSYRCCYNHLS